MAAIPSRMGRPVNRSMYQDPYAPSPWWRILRVLSASFRVGRFFGVEVRLYWIGLILLPLIGLLEWGRLDPGPPTAEVLFRSLIFTALLFVIVWSHEMGHVFAARRYGVHTPLITISPLGGLAHLGAPVPTPKSDVFVSLMGPVVHLPWLAIAWVLREVVPWDWMRPTGWWAGPPYIVANLLWHMNVVLLLFNLLPLFPLDGGRVLRAVLSMKMNPNRATIIACRIGQVGAVAMGIYGLFRRDYWGSILFVIGLTSFFACLREIRAARYHQGPYQEADSRQPWESDPDAWKRGGGGGDDETDKGPGLLRRMKPKPKEVTQEEVDRVLDRVNEVGMAGLTKAEKRILQRASKGRRG